MDSRVQIIYQTAEGRSPYEEWLSALRDVVGRAKVKIQVRRATLGNLGDHRSVGGGVVELKIHYGPGYRVYIGLRADELILLSGGSKGSQGKDILKARTYWEDYKKDL